ncbi:MULTISPECIES: iron-sulfur binding hydrogenase [unclassified Oceanispirochaeta]|uniref:iron-sulfur binding hydrogenase n=1 Tax=unclassified Oceanispirochaeta TaxID=2635722 RepID=UPI000E091DC6|nr:MULTISPECIES: iron-sulfur binding hydrogenase [unclassified Oceanispirochaeta]MBF9015456.1 iron-sulfur binding hydrogenase [Oceanispirochaeta sp. M2]NPD71915.1 iron-sulfur binding hydrogenase [Oceanispirochaeta sp. M1]RDG32724.1 iron-sulfur binding hydrogenase [Oceanispirochaeta sp. M1]
MKVKDLAEKLSYECLVSEGNEEEILDGYTSDLLSDVMGNSPEDSILITIQAHKNTVAVASLANINVLLICNNRPAPDDMLKAAADEGISVFRTKDNQFTASWKVHELL